MCLGQACDSPGDISFSAVLFMAAKGAIKGKTKNNKLFREKQQIWYVRIFSEENKIKEKTKKINFLFIYFISFTHTISKLLIFLAHLNKFTSYIAVLF